MKRFAWVLTVVTFVGVAVGSEAWADLIKNGSFETATTQTLQPLPYATTPTDSGTFNYVADYRSVSIAGVNNWSSNGRVWYLADKDVAGSAATGSAPDGNWVVRVSDTVDGLRGVLAQGGLNLAAGVACTLSFDLWAETATPASLSIRLADATNILDTAGGSNTLMVLTDHVKSSTPIVEHVSTTFTPVIGAAYALQFYTTSGIDNSQPGHLWLDNVSLSPVPEPGSLVLLAVGLVGLLAYAWRKR